MTTSSLFGSDSESDSDSSLPFVVGAVTVATNRSTQESKNETDGNRVVVPQGFYHFKSFLPIEFQSSFIDRLIRELPLTEDHNQLMYFGHPLPPPLQSLFDQLFPTCSSESSSARSLNDLPHQLWSRIKEELKMGSIQMIVNLYTRQKGKGSIERHIDLPNRYGNFILGLSFLSQTTMQLHSCRTTTTTTTTQSCSDSSDDEVKGMYEVVLKPGDLYVLSDESRYEWEHGIEQREFDIIDRRQVKRDLRISVTIRTMKKGGEIVGS